MCHLRLKNFFVIISVITIIINDCMNLCCVRCIHQIAFAMEIFAIFDISSWSWHDAGFSSKAQELLSSVLCIATSS